MARDGMLARYSYIVFLKSGYDDKIVCGGGGGGGKNQHTKC